MLAIVFGFIFWNQFSNNQQDLAGGNSQTSVGITNKPSSKAAIPKNDNISSIETELNGFTADDMDSDSAQFNSELNGF